MDRRGQRPHYQGFSVIIHTCDGGGGHADDRATLETRASVPKCYR
jgi:hypothetical protein